ncbi:MAG TPA: hypothetical protein VKU00_14215 [Chthonomonadaceae bacterium]|nr:hypothetical protein [Chthonomonadaceae bacterium]
MHTVTPDALNDHSNETSPAVQTPMVTTTMDTVEGNEEQQALQEHERHMDVVHGEELCGAACAVAGAFAGSLVGPAGTLAGALIGGTVGAVVGGVAVYATDKITHRAA